MFNMEGIGAKIKELRKNSNYKSLDELADKIGTTRQTLAKWEKGDGTSSPGVWDLQRLCEIFDCDFGYILGEYNCKTRIRTDIQAVTNLSEDAIKTLTTLNKMELRFINDLLENAEQLKLLAKTYCQYRDSKYNSKNMGITTYSGKITYESAEGNNITVPLEQLYNYLQFDLMREVLNFVDRK